MPTSLLSIASSSLSVRYKEPFLSEGMNAKTAPYAPGIYEGFRLVPAFNALSVEVQADSSGLNHAVYRNTDGRTIVIRTVSSVTLNLSAKASKTVVVCVYAQYSTTATTAAEYRMYELSPVDEFTGAADREFLVVLGTVTVPASGQIPATSISNLYRTYAADTTAPQAAPRVQVIDDPYFSLGDDLGAGVTVDSTSHKFHPTVGWTSWSDVASAVDTRLRVVADPSKKGGKLLEISAPTPLTGVGFVAARLQADVGLRVGDMFRDDWVDVYFEYEVVATGTALELRIEFEDGRQNSSSYVKTFSPTVASTGVKTFHTAFRISEVEDDSNPGNFPQNPVYLTAVSVVYNKTSPTAGVTYLRLRELRVSAVGTKNSDGEQDVASKSRRFVESVGARIVRFANSFEGTHNLTEPFQDAPALFAAELAGKELIVGDASGRLSTTAFRAGGTVYGGVNQTSLSIGSFETTHSTAYKLLFKSTATISVRIYGNTDAVLITSNAVVTSGTTWGKDTNGTAAYALKISTAGVRFLNQVGGTNSWADAAWLDAGDGLVLDSITQLWADSTGIAATTLHAILTEIVADLADSTSGTSGSKKIGANTTATWANSVAVSGSTVDAVLETIVGQLGGTTGPSRIGIPASGYSGARSASGGGGLLNSHTDLAGALTQIDTQLTARRAFTATVSNGTTSTGGDLNGASALDSIGTAGAFLGGHFFVRKGNYSVANPWPTESWYPKLVGELVEPSSRAKVICADTTQTLAGIYENLVFTSLASGLVFTVPDNSRLEFCRVECALQVSTLAGRSSLDRVIFDDALATGKNTNGFTFWDAGNVGSGVKITDSVFRPPSLPSATDATVFLSAAFNTGDDGVSFEGCYVSGGVVNSLDCIALKKTSTSRAVFRNTVFENTSTTFTNYLIDISGAANLVFENCTFRTVCGQVIKAAETGATFKNCYFESGSNSGGVTDPIFLLGCGKDNENFLRFENCYFKVGTANQTTNGARAWWALGNRTSASTKDTGVTGLFSMLNCVVQLPNTGNLHRGTGMVFVGSAVEAAHASVNGLVIDAGAITRATAVGTAFDGGFDPRPVALAHFSGNYTGGSSSRSRTSLVVNNLSVRNYGGLSTNLAASVLVVEAASLRHVEVAGNGAGTANHTSPLVLAFSSGLEKFSISSNTAHFHCTATSWFSFRDSYVVSSYMPGAPDSVVPSVGYVEILGGSSVFQNNYVFTNPTVNDVPLCVVTGGPHLIQGNQLFCTRTATGHDLIRGTAVRTRYVNNEVIGNAGTPNYVAFNITGNYCIVMGNIFGSSSNGTTTFINSGTGSIGDATMNIRANSLP